MADKFDRNAGLFVKIFFEWKNHQQLVEIAAKSPHSMLPPSPNLRGYVIDCRKTQSFQLSRKPHVEVGIIDENYQVRFSLNRGVAKPVESLPYPPESCKELFSADNIERCDIPDNLDSGSAHFGAA